MKLLLAILFFGILGVLARYLTVQFFIHKNLSDFPWGTLSVNLIGSFLIGLIVVFIRERGFISSEWFQPLIVGFLGGFTTFSSFSYEVINLMESGRSVLAASYLVGAPVAGAGACFLGFILGRIL